MNCNVNNGDVFGSFIHFRGQFHLQETRTVMEKLKDTGKLKVVDWVPSGTLQVTLN